jgi:selenide,water dikinase
VKSPNALVGYATSDDAAVYRLRKDLAVVETVDFFPPVVDDPFQFGRIAAANALSDVWAMGAKPLFALSLVGFPKELPLKTLQRILAGGHAAAHEAGIPILGGHSVQDPEPKYGLAVTGTVHPRRILRNVGARPGDILFLTKPIGSGIATTAIKRGLADRKLTRAAVALMGELNKTAGEVFASGRCRVNALTDVTGFGLLGHLWEMARGSKVRAVLELERIPLMAGVPKLAAADCVPGGSKANLEWVRPHVEFPEGLPQDIQWVLADAQTNGGLLASVPSKDAPALYRALQRKGVAAAVIGQVVKGKPGITVVG